MPYLLSIAVLASAVLLPLILVLTGRPLQSLFDNPKPAAMRLFFGAVAAGQAICAAIWLATDFRILGAPIHLWATWGFVIYFWIRVSQLVRDGSIAPPASPLQ